MSRNFKPGEPIAQSIAGELNQVPNSPFVDWRPRSDEGDMIRMMMAPMQGIANRIDRELGELRAKIERLELRAKSAAELDCI